MPAPKTRRKRAAKKPTRPAPEVPPASRQRLLRTSERTTFKTCRWQWLQNYHHRLRPIEEKPALRFGTLVHAALEARYPKGIQRGPKPAGVFEKLYAADLKASEELWGMRDGDDEWTKALELGVDMLEGFVDEYGRDEEWEVVQSEMTFQVPVFKTCFHCGGGAKKNCQVCKGSGQLYDFTYVGTMDGVWKNRMDGRVRVIDWKTTSKNPVQEGASKGVLDEQATAYWTWGVDYLIQEGILKPRDQQAMDGMLYTFLFKGKKDPRPVDAAGCSLNQDGSVSKQQPTPRFHRELVYRQEADREAARLRVIQELDDIRAVEREQIAAYKNPATGSMGHCGWCAFRDACELHEVDSDWEEMLKVSMVEWDPYDAHEIAEEGKRS